MPVWFMWGIIIDGILIIGGSILGFGAWIVNQALNLSASGTQIKDKANQNNIPVSDKVINHDIQMTSASTGITDRTPPRLVIKSDGSSVTFDEQRLSGGSKRTTESVWKDGDTVYEWNEQIGSDLTIIKDGYDITITNFTNGDLGIHLKMEKPPEPKTYTTEEVNAKWYYSLGFWQSSNWPASSSNTFAYFDTLPWSIGLQNIETSIDGPGKWVPTIIYGNPPGLTSPTVALSEVLSEIQSLAIYNEWKQAYPEDPIILDLNGNGIELTSVQNGVYFDLDNSNFAEKAAWVGTNDAVLVYDRNNNGIIDGGTETFTFQTLSELDSNQNGIIDANDDNFAKLKLLKGDGTIQTMDEAGIKSLSLSYISDNTNDSNGNTRIGIGSYTDLNDIVHEMSEFNLLRNPVDSIPLQWVDVPIDIAA